MQVAGVDSARQASLIERIEEENRGVLMRSIASSTTSASGDAALHDQLACSKQMNRKEEMIFSDSLCAW